MRLLTAAGIVCVALSIAEPARAQNWSFDARNVALGGIGSGGNIAVNMVEEQRPYRAIVLPFGLLFQVLPNMGKLNPSEDDFDLVRSIEYLASPLHYIVERNTTDTGQQFISDIRNAELNLDLNAYRGFTLPTETSAEGLASPSWGGTIKLKKNADDGTFQGIYIGAGPYMSIQSGATIDSALTNLLSSTTAVFAPNTSFPFTNDDIVQVAMAITGGYRARVAWPGRSGEGQGLYIGANYHYLKGFHYEGFNLAGRLDTNAAGLLTVNAAKGDPLIINRHTASNGSGFAVDVGAAAVVDRMEFGFGVNGIGNRIDWNDVERTDFALSSLLTGGEFNESPTLFEPDVRVELPVDYRANVAFNEDAFTVSAEFANGFNGASFRGGYEHRFSRIQLRGGARFIGERVEPSGGMGFNITRGFGMDVGVFGTSANLERDRQLAIAVSMRFTPTN